MILSLYVLLAVLQGQGAFVEFYGSLSECEATYGTMAAATQTLALSLCTKVELTPPPVGYDKGARK